MIMLKDGLIRKFRLIPKFMTPQTGQQIVNVHTLSNISRSKSNQTMKLHQLVKYKIRSMFVKKSYSKCGEKGRPRPLYENP